MKRPEWLDTLSIISICILVVGVALALSLMLIGCESGRILRAQGTPDPFLGGEVAYFSDPYGDPTLAVWKDGRTCLTVGLEAMSCGELQGFPPREWTVGPPVLVARAFTGTGQYPQVGDVLTGTVFASSVIDSFLVTGGSFTLNCVAPDTLVGVVWLRVPALAPCGRDSMVRHLNLTRVEVPE